MACRITYNSDNQPTGVVKRNGQESQLFREVLNHPMVENFEEALSIYKNTETSKLYQKEENYLFANRANGEVFTSYRAALNTEAGDIEIGFFDNSGNFTPIKTIQPSLDPKTPKGFINLQVKQGIIGEQKVFKNGVAYFQPRGATQSGRGINDMILGDEALANLGWRGFQRTANGYTFLPYETDYTPTAHEAIMEKEIKNIFAEVRSAKQTTEDGNQLDEQDLKLRLLDFLNNIGVNFVAISDYVEKYKIKNGVEPSAKALADISNQIIALQNGELDTETLIEEVAHFIVEGWEQSEVENLLRNIHRTPEWQQFSDEYREIYSREYTGDKIDQAVRREVLGKVLANSLKNNFSTEAAQGVQKSIIDRVRDFFNQFIDFLRGRTTQTLQDDLSSFTEDVNDLLYQNQLESFINKDNFKGNDFKLYSTGSAKNVLKGMNVEISQTLKFLEQNIKQLRGTKASFKTDQNKINRNIRQLELAANDAIRKQAATEMVTIASSQVEYLNNLIKEGEVNEQYLFGSQANATYQTLVHNVSPLISSMQNNIENNKDEYPPKEWAEVITQLEGVVRDIQKLRGKSNNIYKGTFNKIVDRIMLKHDLPESYRKNVQGWVETAQKDTSYFHRYFGQIVNSRDPLLGMVSEIGERTFIGANQESMPVLKQFQSFIRNLGVKEGDLKKLNDKGFLVDETDHGKIDDFIKTVSAETRKEVAPTTDTVEQIKEKARKRQLPELSPDQKSEYERVFKERLLQVQERFRTKEYYDDLKTKYTGISKETIDTISGYSVDRMSIIRDIIDENGVIDYSKLSLSEMEQLKALTRKREQDKSPYNTLGTLKEGISEASNESQIPPGAVSAKWRDVWYYVDSTKTNEDSSGRVAIDLINLDEQFLKKIKEEKLKAEAAGLDTTEEIPQLFKDKVAEIESPNGAAPTPESRAAAIFFIESNANIGFNQEFWEEVSPDNSYLETQAERIEDPDGLEVIEKIRSLSNRRSALIRQFKKFNKTFETDAEKMRGDTKRAIRDLDNQIQVQYTELLAYLPKVEQTDEEAVNPIYQSEVNEAYQEKVADRDFTPKEEIEFIIDNSTESARARIALFSRAIKGYLAGRGGLTPAQEEFVKNYNSTDSLTLEDADRYTVGYARTQVASYYKRFVPQEYTEVFAQRETAKTATDYLNALEKAKYVDVRPNYSFQDSQENFINPNYDPNYEGGYQMQKGDVRYNAPIFNEQGEVTGTEERIVNFESEKYKDLFGTVTNNTASKNQGLYQAYQELLNIQRQTLENTDLTNRHNLFKAPQITKKGVDRGKFVLTNMSPKGIGQNLKEMFAHRVDDVEYGQTVGRTNMNIVPTYYTQDIENANELSDEFFYSYAMMYQQSVLHKHRKNNIGEMLAVKDALEKRNTSQNAGVDAKNTMSMFDNYVDYAFYGKQETQEFKIKVLGQEVDMTKFARVLLNFVKLRNLAMNPLIAATSWFTGEVNFQIEKRIGEILNASSTRLGTREFGKLASDAIKETGQLESKARLNVLGEYFSVFNLMDRYDNPGYNWLVRNGKNAGWAVHQMANFPISPRAMLAVLYDNRVVEGRIVNYTAFKRSLQEKNSNITNKDAEAEWAKYEDNAMYNYMSTDNGTVELKSGFKSLLAPELANDEYIGEKMNKITQQVKRAVSQLDQQITESQRVAAQRHFALNYLMTHRSWFSITLSNRTKNAHYNTTTGEYEEGSYRSFIHFAETAIKDFTSKGVIESFKAAWRGDDISKNGDVDFDTLLQTRRRNMKRVGLDTAWVLGMGAITFLLMAYADDDDDNYGAQLASYLMMRTLNETVSSGTAIPNQLYETLNSPFVGIGVLKDAVMFVPNMFNSDIVQSGKFKGETHRWKAFSEVVPGLKVLGDLSNLKGTRDTYYFYNASNINTSPAALIDLMAVED